MAPRPSGATRWTVWGTAAELVVTDAAALPRARALVVDGLAEVDRVASRFRHDSELVRLTPGADGTVEVSALLAELLTHALRAARSTDGAVDPTLGGALAALGYDRDLALLPRVTPRTRPEPAPVVRIRRRHGWQHLVLDGRRLTLPEGTVLDLGATAKAVAADRCAQAVHERLGVGVLVSLGGDVATAGPGPDDGWQVVVQDLPDDVPQQVTLAPGAAMATSSTVCRAWARGDRVVHHLLDPRTGGSADTPWRTASVVAPTCVLANTASTATLVKGSAGLPWLRRSGMAGRLVGYDGDVVRTGGWPEEVAA